MCPSVVEEFHAFLESTVKVLHEVQEKQMLWQWKGNAVFDGVVWLQGLWASRSAVCRIASYLVPTTASVLFSLLARSTLFLTGGWEDGNILRDSNSVTVDQS